MSQDRINRIIHTFNEIRANLIQELAKMDEGEFEWEPKPGMKSIKAQIQEVAHMEFVCRDHAKTGITPDWQTAVTWPGEDVESHIEVLGKVRSDSLEYLRSLADSDLDEHVELPEKWKAWWGSESIAREEFFRWIGRHEYYHVGQITTFLWTLGKNPYDEAG
jgi:uncharacterized damage-inducible protein DinB